MTSGFGSELFRSDVGQTPLDPDEADALIPSISTRSELNELESANIASARLVVFRRSKNWLSLAYFQNIHKKMFGDVWRWAGQFRQTGKNIGVDWHTIPTELKKLCEDTRYWLDHQTFTNAALCARFHHRLVSIHPFVNGNGRHARLMTELVVFQANLQQKLTWGTTISSDKERRKKYIAALQHADHGDAESLEAFLIS